MKRDVRVTILKSEVDQNLPLPVEQIMEDVDAVIVTHLHPDHIDISPIDGTVGAPLDKKIQIYCQNEEDAAVLEKSGFSRITVLPLTGLKVGNAKITRIPAKHGTYKNCGEAMGVMFSAETEKTFYLAGDTVWYYGVQKAINAFKPEVIALNCCAAETKENGRLIMGAEDVWNVSLTAPEANILLCAIFSVKKKVFLCAEPAIHSGKDSQLCGEEIFLFSQS